MHPIIGINLPDCKTTEQLRDYLTAFTQDGYDSVEITLDTFPLIIGGNICREWVDLVKEELAQHQLLYSAHIGRGVDLRNPETALHRHVLRASIDICAEIGADPLVLHYEEQTKSRTAEDRFLEGHREAAAYAQERGITLCLENIEVEVVDPVVELVDRIGSSHLRLALDTGHTYLAAGHFGFDFFEAVAMMKPYLAHVHLSDNTGVFEQQRITDRPAYDALPMGYRRAFGRGDIHVPPYYGSIPFDRLFSMLSSYKGRYICEYTSEDFIPLNKEIQKTVRRRLLASAAPAEDGSNTVHRASSE